MKEVNKRDTGVEIIETTPNPSQNQNAFDLTALEDIFNKMIPAYTNSAESIYHYTTLEALLGGIIPEKPDAKLCFRATNVDYMNDPQEMRINLEELKEIIDTEFTKKLYDAIDFDINENKSTYIIAFSENKDTLPMWSMYGKNGNGVLLEFDRSKLHIEKYPLIKCIYQESDLYYQIMKVIRDVLDDKKTPPPYAKSKFFLLRDMARHPNDTLDKRKERINKDPNITGKCDCDCEELLSEFSAFLLTSLYPVITYKHSAYDFEKELRLVFQESDPSMVKYRHRDGMLVPFIDKLIERDALKSIIIGPTQDFDRSKKSLEMFLKARGFENVDIRPSSVPYRG